MPKVKDCGAGKGRKSEPKKLPPTAATAATSASEAAGSYGETADCESSGGEEAYSPAQVAAIILPVVLVMMVVLVISLAGMWLVLQRRKRSQ